MVENTAVAAVAASAFDSEVLAALCDTSTAFFKSTPPPAANRDKVQDHNDSRLRCLAKRLSA